MSCCIGQNESSSSDSIDDNQEFYYFYNFSIFIES